MSKTFRRTCTLDGSQRLKLRLIRLCADLLAASSCIHPRADKRAETSFRGMFSLLAFSYVLAAMRSGNCVSSKLNLGDKANLNIMLKFVLCTGESVERVWSEAAEQSLAQAYILRKEIKRQVKGNLCDI